MLCKPMMASTPQASWRTGSVSRHGRACSTQASTAPHATAATGRPNSTARCKGRLWALSSSVQKRAPGNRVM